MLKEAADAGFYQPPGVTDRFPRLQVLSIAELLRGKAEGGRGTNPVSCR